FGSAVFEPGTAPALDRQMRHVGVDIDPGHQPTAKPEFFGDGVVVDLVLRDLGGVVGLDGIGGEFRHGGAHFFSSPAMMAVTLAISTLGCSMPERSTCSSIPTRLSRAPQPRVI